MDNLILFSLSIELLDKILLSLFDDRITLQNFNCKTIEKQHYFSILDDFLLNIQHLKIMRRNRCCSEHKH